jgi:hypothetical protein
MEKNMKQKLLQPMPCRAVTLLYQQVLSSAKNFRGSGVPQKLLEIKCPVKVKHCL